MLKAVLEGNKEVHNWCKVSWFEHLSPYTAGQDVLLIKYEDALKDTYSEAKRILHFLEEERSEADIQKAVDNQSFGKVKERFKQTGDGGKAEQWRKQLSQKEKELFKKELGEDVLKEFGFPL